jgi:hypothetical protein
MQVFSGYFEEPEPGVPEGCTGWYHSGGRFEVRSAAQVFTTFECSRSLIREEVAGPFTCRDEAMADLQQTLGG